MMSKKINYKYFTITSIYLVLFLATEVAFLNNPDFQKIKITFYIYFVIILLFNLLVAKYYFSDFIKQVKNINTVAEQLSNSDFKLDKFASSENESLSNALNNLYNSFEEEITKLKKIENYRKEFLGNVSHELRTPLFAIQSSIETLLNGAIEDNEVNKNFLESALRNLNRLESLLNDLIEISRIESGELTMSFRFFEIGTFIESIKNEFSVASAQKGIKIETQILNPKTNIYADKERLLQVFSNLIDNAIKYSNKNCKIIINAIDEIKSVKFEIVDEGFGISNEHINRIFERFYRIDKARSRDVGGTGLGLSISKHIVEAHNSTLKVKSELGKGSTFYFTISK